MVSVLLLSFSIMAKPTVYLSSASDQIAIDSVPLPGSNWVSENFMTLGRRDNSATNASGWGTGTVTSQRDYTFFQLDQYSISEGAQSVAVQGRRAYVATYSLSPLGWVLRSMNVTNPRQVSQLVAWELTWSLIYDLKVEGDILYVVSRFGDLRLYNVSNPHATPILTDSRSNFGGNWPQIDIQGRFLYGACDDLRIINIEDPYNIYSVSNTSLPASVYDVDVVGNMAYLSTSNGFYIVNVSSPYSPSVVASIGGLGTSFDLHVDGNIVYYPSWSTIQLIDVSVPSQPTVLGYYTLTNNIQSLALQGNTLFLGDDSGTIAILDVIDPLNPTYVDEFDTGAAVINDLTFYNGDLVIATSSGLVIYRVGSSSGGLTDLPLLSTFTGYPVFDVKILGNIAYLAAGPEGLLALNVSDPVNPVLLDKINHTSPVDYDAVVVQGHYCFVADDGGSLEEGLLAFNVTDPTNLQFLDYYPVTNINDLAVVGDVAYLAAGNDGLYLINVTDPNNMSTRISNVTDGNSYWDLCVQGHFVYATAMYSSPPFDFGFYIYDATNLSSLVLTNRTTKPFWLSDVAVDGDIGVLAEGDRGISLQNVTNPFDVSTFSLYNLPGSNASTGVEIFGPYVIITEGFGGIHLLNATNPRTPQLIASYNATPMIAAMATMQGDYLYVANGTSLMIFRLFRSPGSTYNVSDVVAQSIDIHSDSRLIENATLTFDAFLPYYTSAIWQLTADGGVHWETVSLGVLHEFTYRGNDLRWRSIFSTNYDDRSPHLYQLDITWWYNEPPLAPSLDPIQDPDGDGAFTVSWSAGWDFDGTISYYQLQLSNESNFSNILQEWTPAVTSQAVSGLIGITYYFRVLAYDNDGVPSSWSNVESIGVANQPPTTPTLYDPGTTDDDGVFTVSWSTSIDPEGTTIEYTLEMFDTATMDNSLSFWQTSTTSIQVDISDFGSGTYYFAVIAEDEQLIRSGWSNVESITIELPTTPPPPPPPIPGFPIEAIIVGLLLAVILVLIRRRRRHPS